MCHVSLCYHLYLCSLGLGLLWPICIDHNRPIGLHIGLLCPEFLLSELKPLNDLLKVQGLRHTGAFLLTIQSQVLVEPVRLALLSYEARIYSI